MERLTFDGNFCDIVQRENTPNGSYCESDGSCFLRKVWERLKAYETTGLTPEACAEAREAGKVLSSCDISFRRLAELLTADRAGRLAVLPCKAGDTVYRIVRDADLHIARDEVRNMYFADDMTLCVELVGGRIILSEKFGKTVFMTREEAEKALEAMKDE